MSPSPADLPAAFPCGPVTLAGPAGALQAHASCPLEARGITAVICHPHPLHGGTMDNKVVTTLARALDASGAHTIRFNFRGVGQSAGHFGDLVGEVEDLMQVAAWARAALPGQELWLAGFSFGAVAALRAAVPLSAARLITVAPAVPLYDLREVQCPTVPWLLVMGDADEIVAPAAVRDWAVSLPRPPRIEWLAGAGHFFHQRLPDLRERIASFAQA